MQTHGGPIETIDTQEDTRDSRELAVDTHPRPVGEPYDCSPWDTEGNYATASETASDQWQTHGHPSEPM